MRKFYDEDELKIAIVIGEFYEKYKDKVQYIYECFDTYTNQISLVEEISKAFNDQQECYYASIFALQYLLDKFIDKN